MTRHCEKSCNLCESSPITCQDCRVNGRVYTSQYPFQFQDGCYRYNCQCNCDGSYNCPASKTVDTCNRCRECNVDGRRIPGNSYFPHISSDRCWYWDACVCNCDGSYSCPRSSSRNLC